MKPSIKQIRELLSEHNYLADKTIDVSTVKTGKKYLFVCDEGHEFESLVSNVFQSGKFGCPICHGRRVLKGFNDIWTTHPEIAKRLKNPEDGYRYNAGSNVKLWWMCPDCGDEICVTPNKFITRKCLCTVCDSDTSYPEKFILNLLNQCSVYFEKEKIFDWSEGKRYDFYISLYDCIIEVHGKQHYTNSDFSYLGGKTYLEEQRNDDHKKFMAIEYGNISNYIVLDCRKSDMQWIKRSVIQSDLLNILRVVPDTINWNECDEFAVSNLTKLICKTYKSGERNIKNLCKIFHLSYNSIREKLKHGSKLGWCDYDPNIATKRARKENGQRIIKTMSKPVIQMDMDCNDIQEFCSLQEAQRILSVSHIWDCIVGKRNSAGGYKWRYKDEFERH